jgi:hypothetical protein
MGTISVDNNPIYNEIPIQGLNWGQDLCTSNQEKSQMRAV